MSDSTAVTMTEKQLTIFEDKIRKGQAAFIEVGHALREIKERNAFQLRGFKTFDEYCSKTFGFSERNGYRMIAAAETAKKIEDATGDKPRNEATARVLSKITHDPKLIERVQQRLKTKGESIATATAERIEQVVEAIRPKTKPMFDQPKEEPKPVLPTLSDTCPICHEQPMMYTRHDDGWHCGIASCNALVMVGVIPLNVQACPECGAAILNAGAEFCETCGCILEAA